MSKRKIYDTDSLGTISIEDILIKSFSMLSTSDLASLSHTKRFNKIATDLLQGRKVYPLEEALETKQENECYIRRVIVNDLALLRSKRIRKSTLATLLTHINITDSEKKLQEGDLPQTITHLTIKSSKNINSCILPRQLLFLKFFDGQIGDLHRMEHLKYLVTPNYQRLPDSLTHLSIKISEEQEVVSIPKGINYLEIRDIENPETFVEFPDGLTHLAFLLRDLEYLNLPDSLTHLRLPYSFIYNESEKLCLRNTKITHLTLDSPYLRYVVYPDSLTNINIFVELGDVKTDIDANNLKTTVQGITRGKKIDVRIIIRYFKDIDDQDIEHVVHCLSILEASKIGKCVIHNTDLDSWYNWRYVDIYDEGPDAFDPLSQY